MKKSFLLIFTFLVLANIYAQNVGIGTNTPQYPLDVNGRVRIMSGGDVNTAGLWLNNSANNSSPVFFGMRNDSLAGFFGNISSWRFLMNTNSGNIALGDFNPSRPLSFPATLEKKISLYPGTTGDAGFGVFGNELRINSDNSSADITLGYDNYQNGFTERMRIKGNGNVGIGENNPGFRLNFASTPGDKISLYGNSGAHYGFGIQGSLLQIHSAGSGDDIAFGYGSSGAFTERMRIKGNGNVGIAVSDPAYLLDLGGRIRIRGLPGFTAGLWLNNEINSAIPAFIGMQTDNQVGFYGSGTGWGLSMNTQNGALNIGGSTGTAGQVLVSNGASASPSWVPAGTIIQTGYSGATQDVILTGLASQALTASTSVVTVSVPSRIILSYKTVTSKDCLIGSCNTKWSFTTVIDNVQVGHYYVDGASYQTITSASFLSSHTFGPDYFDVNPGTHTFTFYGFNIYNEPKIAFFQAISTIITR